MVDILFLLLPSFIVGLLVEAFFSLCLFVVDGEFIAVILLASLDILSDKRENP